jgi:hypothetical protein
MEDGEDPEDGAELPRKTTLVTTSRVEKQNLMVSMSKQEMGG